MKFRNIISSLTVTTLLFCSTTACSQIGKITANKNYITKDVSVPNFDAIKLLGSPDLIYTQSKDGKTKVQIYGSDNIVELLETKVINNTLTVKYKDKINIMFNKDGRLKVLVSTPSLRSATLQGSGSIVLNGDINAQDLFIDLSGSGDIKGEGNISCTAGLNVQLSGSGDIDLKKEVRATTSKINLSGSGDLKIAGIVATTGSVNLQGSGDLKVEKNCRITHLKINLNGSGNMSVLGINSTETLANLSGSGDVKLKGNTQNATFELRNSGTIYAEKLQSQNVIANINGSGNINCHAISKLNAKINGSGNIGYKGNPIIEQVNRKSGRIRKL